MIARITLSEEELREAVGLYLQEKYGPRMKVTVKSVEPKIVAVDCSQEPEED